MKRAEFIEALKGKDIPILTLDNKWYRLFEVMSEDNNVASVEKQLNKLLRRQGKLNTESKDIKKLKKKLMNEIVPMVDDLGQNPNSSLGKQIDSNKKLIDECNERLERYQEELLDLPKDIRDCNIELMVCTMDYCYRKIKENTEEIDEITNWVVSIRKELKKKLIRKQEREQRNFNIYSYMHDIFGANVIEIFDMKYNPEQQHPKQPQEEENKTE